MNYQNKLVKSPPILVSNCKFKLFKYCLIHGSKEEK